MGPNVLAAKTGLQLAQTKTVIAMANTFRAIKDGCIMPHTINWYGRVSPVTKLGRARRRLIRQRIKRFVVAPERTGFLAYSSPAAHDCTHHQDRQAGKTRPSRLANSVYMTPAVVRRKSRAHPSSNRCIRRIARRTPFWSFAMNIGSAIVPGISVAGSRVHVRRQYGAILCLLLRKPIG